VVAGIAVRMIDAINATPTVRTMVMLVSFE
jgi:hypothetical protein